MSCRIDPVATYHEPLLGWRIWRVERIRTLNQGQRFRLCAIGDHGNPKVWQPRQANVASCSQGGRHDAPYPAHDCGIYAHAEQELAEKQLVMFESWQSEYQRVKHKRDTRPWFDTWVIGRVSLWGRVVECELGWRAQYAYPYDVTVFSSGKAPDQVAADYAIDVTAAPKREIKTLFAKYPETAETARGDSSYQQWYTTSLYGTMDSEFLRPYHDEVMARFDAIERTLARTLKAHGVRNAG